MHLRTLDLSQPNLELIVNENTEFKALYIGRSSDSIKSEIKIIHKKPNITSRVHIKAVVFDNAKFDVEPLLIIEKGASNTDTYLKVDCLVMSDTAFARAVPSLEIKENEVKGGHGATIGYIDPEMIHYLKSRGLTKEQSEELIIEAFIQS